MPDGRPVRCVVVVGNIGGSDVAEFRAPHDVPAPDPLDDWTRATLAPIAVSFGASFVHPSDEPFQPFQRWAQRADDVWQSPIGLLIHGEFGLWHAYRGAFLFPESVTGLPEVGADRVALRVVRRSAVSERRVRSMRSLPAVTTRTRVAPMFVPVPTPTACTMVVPPVGPVRSVSSWSTTPNRWSSTCVRSWAGEHEQRRRAIVSVSATGARHRHRTSAGRLVSRPIRGADVALVRRYVLDGVRLRRIGGFGRAGRSEPSVAALAEPAGSSCAACSRC